MDSKIETDGTDAEKNAPDVQARLARLLAQAARVAAANGVAPEVFTNAAWQAYLQASPGLAERLVEMQLDAVLEEMRSSGRLAKV